MKYAGEGVDPYLDKDTGVLRNLLGISDQAELDNAESSLSFLRASQLLELPVEGEFDLAHLQAIHKRLFGDVYDWAGQVRQVEIQRGDTVFARQLFGHLALEQHLSGLDDDRFGERAGYFLGEINVLHPFREGNGRAQREFISQLARSTGRRIDWTGVSQAQMTRASIAAYRGDPSGLAGIVHEGLRR